MTSLSCPAIAAHPITTRNATYIDAFTMRIMFQKNVSRMFCRQAVRVSPSVIFGFASDIICQTQPK